MRCHSLARVARNHPIIVPSLARPLETALFSLQSLHRTNENGWKHQFATKEESSLDAVACSQSMTLQGERESKKKKLESRKKALPKKKKNSTSTSTSSLFFSFSLFFTLPHIHHSHHGPRTRPLLQRRLHPRLDDSSPARSPHAYRLPDLDPRPQRPPLAAAGLLGRRRRQGPRPGGVAQGFPAEHRQVRLRRVLRDHGGQQEGDRLAPAQVEGRRRSRSDCGCCRRRSCRHRSRRSSQRSHGRPQARPRGYSPDVPTPLIVALHGANKTAFNGMATVADAAAAAGAIVVAPSSRDPATWDMFGGGYGSDVAYINASIAMVSDLYNIDPTRVAVQGFSDGATYALSLGLANGKNVFSHVIAFSPGGLAPPRLSGSPGVFISAGIDDEIFPKSVADAVVCQLVSNQYPVTFAEFKGGHSVPTAICNTAVTWFVADAAPVLDIPAGLCSGGVAGPVAGP
jgi:phospholipase/carboxylesterase